MPDLINLEKVKAIESSGDPYAYNNRTQATGLFQITPVALKDWNQLHPKEQYGQQWLFDENVNTKIASWYLYKRIPQMLQSFGLPVTQDNILRAYHDGVGNVAKGYTSSAGKDYLRKYGGQ
jgi:hypothetical protein